MISIVGNTLSRKDRIGGPGIVRIVNVHRNPQNPTYLRQTLGWRKAHFFLCFFSPRTALESRLCLTDRGPESILIFCLASSLSFTKNKHIPGSLTHPSPGYPAVPLHSSHPTAHRHPQERRDCRNPSKGQMPKVDLHWSSDSDSPA